METVKPARQKRSRETHDKLVAALEELLKTKEFDAITIAELAERAGVSTAAIYRRFANKDALIPVLFDLYLQRMDEWARGGAGRVSAPPPTLRDGLKQVGLRAWAQVERHGHLMRPAYLHSRLHPELIGPRWAEFERRAVDGFEQFLRAYPKEVARRDVGRAASMLAYFYNVMFAGRLLHAETPAGWRLPNTAEAFADALADFALGYLTAPAPQRRRRRK
ncbi:MAG: TetR/AcrR family transcriptional regulator [Maricaulaceae bacterium]